jgi:hypothetical protein
MDRLTVKLVGKGPEGGAGAVAAEAQAAVAGEQTMAPAGFRDVAFLPPGGEMPFDEPALVILSSERPSW